MNSIRFPSTREVVLVDAGVVDGNKDTVYLGGKGSGLMWHFHDYAGHVTC